MQREMGGGGNTRPVLNPDKSNALNRSASPQKPRRYPDSWGLKEGENSVIHLAIDAE